MLEDLVWYASYGSNLSKKRFYCYIQGGKPEGSNFSEVGCNDRTLPLKIKTVLINHELLFVESSTRWSGLGVAIINPDVNDRFESYGRMFLITKGQFIDIIKQENKISLSTELSVKFPDGKKVKYYDLFQNRRYGRIINIGTDSGYPVLTFTASKPVSSMPINKPSHDYIKMLSRGLQESYDMSTRCIVDYFIELKGVKNNYKRDELTEIVDSI